MPAEPRVAARPLITCLPRNSLEKARQVVGYYDLPAPSDGAESRFYGAWRNTWAWPSSATKELMLPLTDGFDPKTGVRYATTRATAARSR